MRCATRSKRIRLFTDNKFHDLGVGADARGELNDVGRYAITKVDADMGCFTTPSLRNLADRGRYMHDGGFPVSEGRAGSLHSAEATGILISTRKFTGWTNSLSTNAMIFSSSSIR